MSTIRIVDRSDTIRIVEQNGTLRLVGVAQAFVPNPFTPSGGTWTLIGDMAIEGFFKLDNLTNAQEPAAGDAGRIYWNTDALEVRVDNGTIWEAIAGGGGITDPITVNGWSPASAIGTFTGAFQLAGQAAPPLSPAGSARLYFDSGSNQALLSENGGAYAPIVGAGDVVGPGAGNSTDDALVRWNGATGALVADSSALLSDAGNLTLVGGVFGTGVMTVRSAAGSSLFLDGSVAAGDSIRFRGQTTDEFARMGTDGFRVWRDKTGTLGAEAGDTLVDSRGLEYYGNRWDGFVSQDTVYRVFNQQATAEPFLNKLRWNFAGSTGAGFTERMSLDVNATSTGLNIYNGVTGNRVVSLGGGSQGLMQMFLSGGTSIGEVQAFNSAMSLKAFGNRPVLIRGDHVDSATGKALQVDTNNRNIATAGYEVFGFFNGTFGVAAHKVLALVRETGGNRQNFRLRFSGIDSGNTQGIEFPNDTSEGAQSILRSGDTLVATTAAFTITGDLDHNGTGIGFYGTAPAAQSAAYSRNATIVEDRVLLASASATVINNNNLIAAIIADLQATGIFG